MTVKRKRVVSLLLVLCMLFTLFPLTSLAETTSTDAGTELENLWASTEAESEAKTTFNATVTNGPAAGVYTEWMDSDGWVVSQASAANNYSTLTVTFVVPDGTTAYVSFEYAVSSNKANNKFTYSAKNTEDSEKSKFSFDKSNENQTISFAINSNATTHSVQYAYTPGTYTINFMYKCERPTNYNKAFVRNLKISETGDLINDAYLTVECDPTLAELYVDGVKQTIDSTTNQVAIQRLSNHDEYALQVYETSKGHFKIWEGVEVNKNTKKTDVKFNNNTESKTVKAVLTERTKKQIAVDAYDDSLVTLQYKAEETNEEWRDLAPYGRTEIMSYQSVQLQLVKKVPAQEVYCKSATYIKETSESSENTSASVEPEELVSNKVISNDVLSLGQFSIEDFNAFITIEVTPMVYNTVDYSDISVYGVSEVATKSHMPWTEDDDGLKSENYIENNTLSILRLKLQGSGTLFFEYKVQGQEGDALFVVDGDEPTSYSSLTAEQTVYNSQTQMNGFGLYSKPITKSNDEPFYVYIVYAKDGGGYSSPDCAWVRNIAYVDTTKLAAVNVAATDGGTVAILDKTGTNYNGNLGTRLTVTAQANKNKEFYGWIAKPADGDSYLASTDASYTFIMTEDVTLTAQFNDPNAYVASSKKGFYDNLADAINEAATGTVQVLKNCTLESNAEIKSNVKLLLPFSDKDDSGYELNTETVRQPSIYSGDNALKTTNPYITVTVASNATLTVVSGGRLVVGGVRHSMAQDAQGQTSGDYACLEVNGAVAVQGGLLEVNGLVNGTGRVNQTGGEVKIPYLILDYAGGNNTFCLYESGSFPFVQYATMNIQCDFNMSYGGKVTGSTSLYFFGSSKTQDVPLITSSSADGGLIILGENASLNAKYTTKSVHNTTIKTNEAGTRYVDATGTNVSLDPFGQTLITVTGGATAGGFSLSGYGSETMYFDIPYTYDITLEGGVYTMNNKYRIMPGANLTVAESATLNVNGALQAVDGWVSYDKSGKNYPSTAMLSASGFNTNGSLTVNGTLNIGERATFGGIVATKAVGAKIITSEDSNLSGKNADGTTFFGGAAAGYTSNLSQYELPARIYKYDAETETYKLENIVAGETVESRDGEVENTLPGYTMNITKISGKNAVTTNETVSTDQKINGGWVAAPSVTVTVTSYYVEKNIANANDTAENAAARFTHVLDGTTLTVTKNTTDAASKSGKGYTYLVMGYTSDADDTGTVIPMRTTDGSSIDTIAYYDLTAVEHYESFTAIKIVAIKIGDVNGDGKVNSSDYMRLKNYCLKTTNQNIKNLIDTNAFLVQAAKVISDDGKINSSDYMRLKNYCLKTTNQKIQNLIER